MLPLTVPQDATAVRPTWADLPDEVRATIEERCGGTVETAESMGTGFTPGFASRLRLTDGRRVFVKAADDATRAVFAASYREEIRKLEALPDAIPAPRLRWSHDADGWVILGFDDVAGRHPRRPWRPDELGLVLATIDATAALLTPAPDTYAWDPLSGLLGDDPHPWDQITAEGIGPDWLRPKLPECARLAELGDAAMAGDTIVHADIRDDNVLIDADGQVWFCDWNWPLLGNPAFDTVCVLISAHGDGLDADAWLPRSETTRGQEPEVVDGALALLAGYFWTASQRAAPETSPWLRIHQRWYAEATTDWLARRRGWR
ncbi:MAG: phosphotransferase family protein [Nocardioidaceae bacterium]